MNPPHFTILGEPTRLKILEELAIGDRNVGELVDKLNLSQPAISKHLRVLREAGFVDCKIAGQRRIYRIDSAQFKAIDDWLQPYRTLWSGNLDALEQFLDHEENS
ncbi:MAG: metalloregulator ArsR/SmtB family transcription factor [Proteobacteria bacterium]|nr:metalloregulator ArsR/SmtB family transcription factor [Pseudomonadota bacterium]